ncbi:hypothetical protein Vretimale_17777 [Volvox reticuliferus]|uniref:Uncharacterized protein n=1 Tax=Volvox reticuliferus TaxID=1737510 RepID=A0A8J4D0N8_9CHLO|nr:hypothetical protein Vretifemale_18949 [Volvox reticuliferus]GIM14912.1 hypothetical protein Vretimale_17777 [Volvox reticuliferus]
MGCWSALCGCLSKSCFLTESRAVEGHSSGGAPARPPVPIPSPIVDGPRLEPLPAGPALAPARLSQQHLPVDPAPAGIISIIGMRDQVHAAQPMPLYIRKGQEQDISASGGLADPNSTTQSLNAAVTSGSPAFPVPAAMETLTSAGPPPQLSSPQSSKAASLSTEAPRLLTGSSSWAMQHCTPLQHPTSSEKETAPFAFNMPRPNMVDAAALAVATVARVSPMPNRSFTSRRGPAGAFACSLAGLPHNRSPSTSAGMPHQAAYRALAAFPADLPAQALLDESRTVSISSSDENDDGLPSPTGVAAAAAIEVLQAGGSPHYAVLGHGVPALIRDLQRQNAEEAAFIRGTLAALKQATLAGFEDFGEVEVLPGLPRVRSSHSSYGRGQALSVTSAATNIGLSQSSAASGGPASRRCLTLNAVVHGANLAAIFGGGGGAASAASASASAMLQPLQTSTQTGCGFSGDYLAAKMAAGPASQQTIRAMVDPGEVLGFSYGSPPGLMWENGAHPPARPTDTRPLPAEEPPTGGCVGGREDGVPSPTMLAELPKLPPLRPLLSRHPKPPLQRQQCPIAGPPLTPLEQLPPSTSGRPSPPLPGVGLLPPPPQWPQQQAAGHRYAEVLQQIFARATAAQQQLRQQQQQQMQQLYKAHQISGQLHMASLSAQPQLRVDQPPAQQTLPQRQDEQRRGASTALPAALEPPGALKTAVSAEDAALQLQKPSLPEDSPLPMEMGSGQAGPHECVEVPMMSPLLQKEGAAQEHALLRNGEEAHINIGWNHADSITCASISDCEGKMSASKPAPASTISFTQTQTDANEVSGGIVANRDHPCKATSQHYVSGDDSGRVGGEGAKGPGGSSSSTAASKLSTAEQAALAGGSANERSTGACSAGSGSVDDGVTGGDTAEGCSIANRKSHGDPVEALLTAVSFSAQTNNGSHITVAPLPPAATAAEAEVTAFARQLPSEQRKELAQLVREKWSPFTFPQRFTAESPMRPPVAVAAAAELPRGSSGRILDALPAMVDAVCGDAAPPSGIWSSSCAAATSRAAFTSSPPIFSHMPTWKESIMPQSIGWMHSLSTSGAGSYHRCMGHLWMLGASAAAPSQSTGAKGASQCPPPRVCGDIIEPSKSSCMTAPGHAGLLPSPMRYRSAESSASSAIRSLNAVAVSTETSVGAAYDSGAGVDGHACRDAVQQPTTEQSQGGRCMVAVESVAMALPQPPVLPPSPQHAAAAAAGGAGLGPQLPPLVPYHREQQQGYAMTVDATIVPAAPAAPARAAVTATGVAATASAVETITPRRLLPPDSVADLPGATKSPPVAPAQCNADMDHVRSLVGRKWSPFFDLEANFRLLKAPSVAAPAALPDNARVLDMQPCHGPTPSPILTEPYAAHRPYPPHRDVALRMATGRQPMDNGSGTVLAMAATATQTAATGAVAAATAAAPSTSAPAAGVPSEEEGD